MLREKTRRRRNSFSEGVENCGEPVTGLVLELRSVEVLSATKGSGQDDTGDSEDSVTRDMKVSPVSSVEVMLRASPLGFGLPRPLTFVALPYRLSSIVVPGEARNLLFPHFMCRKKSEEARAFPGVPANGSPLSPLTSSTPPETPPSRSASVHMPLSPSPADTSPPSPSLPSAPQTAAYPRLLC